MKKCGVSTSDRTVTTAAAKRAEETGAPAVAIELPDGRIVTGRTTQLMGPTAAALINSLKELAHIPDEITLISPIIIDPIQRLKTEHFGSRNPRLHSDEVLIALSICAATNPNAARAFEQLNALSGCEAHASVMLSRVDSDTLRKLGIQFTMEPYYERNQLYHK